MFKSRKLIATLMIVAMLLSMIPMTAFAASGISATAVPVVSKAEGQNLGSIKVVIPSGSPTGGEKLTITLPTGVKLGSKAEKVISDAEEDEPLGADVVGAIVPQKYAGETNGLTKGDVTITGTAKESKVVLTFETNVSYSNDALVIIQLGGIDLSTASTGEIVAELDASPNSGIPTGRVTVGVVAGTDGVTLSTSSIDTASTTFGFTLNIKEDAPGSLKEGDQIKLKLPDGFRWDMDSIKSNEDDIAAGVDYKYGDDSIKFSFDQGTSDRELIIKVDERDSSSALSSLAITRLAFVVVDDTVAKTGDIEVAVSTKGLSKNVGKLLVGVRHDFEIKVSMDEVVEVQAGKFDQEIGKIVIKEGVAGSLIPGRTITIKLPSNARWSLGSDGEFNESDYTLTSDEGLSFALSANGRVLTILQKNNATTTDPDKIEIEGLCIDLEANVAGDVEAEVSGSQGVRGTIVVAKAVKPATIQAGAITDVIIGKSGQTVNSFTIKEAKAEAAKGGKDIVVTLPVDVEWSAKPTVKVVEGDMVLGTISYSGRNLTIPVSVESTEASTIEVSNIQLRLYRTVPEGDLKANVGGDALVETNVDVEKRKFYTPWPNSGSSDSAVIAKVVTPAPGELLAKETVFTIGSTTYKVDGVEQTMDVAPYIKDNRTFVPVRYAAQAMGVAEKDIIWDGAKGTATLFKGDRIIQMTIGSNIMTVNGVQIVMDTAPEIVNNRTMLPVGWLAQALNVVATWDGATQTATLSSN